MDYGGYIVIAILVVAIVFFVRALLNYNKARVLKFTFYGYMVLTLVSLTFALISHSRDLLIATLTFATLVVLFRWFYRGIQKDNKRD